MLVDRDEIRDLSNFEVNNTFVILTPSDSNISPPFVQVMKMSSTNASLIFISGEPLNKKALPAPLHVMFLMSMLRERDVALSEAATPFAVCDSDSRGDFPP
jgi:hypothetical protein